MLYTCIYMNTLLQAMVLSLHKASLYPWHFYAYSFITLNVCSHVYPMCRFSNCCIISIDIYDGHSLTMIGNDRYTYEIGDNPFLCNHCYILITWKVLFYFELFQGLPLLSAAVGKTSSKPQATHVTQAHIESPPSGNGRYDSGEESEDDNTATLDMGS